MIPGTLMCILKQKHHAPVDGFTSKLSNMLGTKKDPFR
jgi:hypothetical protein